ncbi:hypothetical protein AAFF_G00262610 [Aldrovandia affinis]|uniref:Zinc finger CCCH domain-containing protein 14 n=1 Tax=Aldrovandia affinis TaxID=143900 RepID=A0AAD7STS6_9TELE|nr:hypothetical protein AAFF_G00262610 [Aldrovandia affinis]
MQETRKSTGTQPDGASMEIGTEISKKIRAAIKGKLQELGAYVDEELPDYIMVMVANKKNAQQMADDLSLFLGNNTIKFTVWLHGVLEKLRSVAVEPASLRPQHMYTHPNTEAGKGRALGGEERRREESRGLTVSSSRSDRTEARVSTSSAHDHHSSSGRRDSKERNIPRLTSAVKPLMEPVSVEAIIDIKPELDDDLISNDLIEEGPPSGGARDKGGVTYGSARPSAALYRPPQSGRQSGGPSRGHGRAPESLYSYRPTDVSQVQNRSTSAYSRGQHSYTQDSRGSSGSMERSAREEEGSRKRKAPVASSIVRVNRIGDEGRDSDELEEEEEEEEDEDEVYTARSGGVSSRVSLPSKPERRPSLPPAKQANKNLILKAISEAQESISKTTNYTKAPQKQTVPVAPRTRTAGEEVSAAIQLVQEHLHALAPRSHRRTPAEPQPTRQAVQSRGLSSRLQLDLPEDGLGEQQVLLVGEVGGLNPSDTRSFIMRRPEVEEAVSVQGRLGGPIQDEAPPTAPRTVQASRDGAENLGSASPKFIVTLDGVPSPLGNLGESDPDVEEGTKTVKCSIPASYLERKPTPSIHQRLQRELPYSDEEEEESGEGDGGIPVKRQKVLERCKFWPVCKSGEECVYHHPTAQCKTFPSCKFGDKCLFVHPNCKYDAKCTKTDCPFTHVSRRGPTPLPRKAPVSTSSVCRFFPDCKKIDCLFYHPKPCRFSAQCKRAGCPFYHPALSVPPRHALKWTKTQSS